MRSRGSELVAAEPRQARQASAGALEIFGLEEARDRARLRFAVGAALLLHLCLFATRSPDLGGSQLAAPERRGLPVLITPRFRPPEPPPEVLPNPRSRLVPVPDPTPDALEPIRTAVFQRPELDLVLDGGILGIPDAPPPDAGSYDAPRPVGGEIAAPVKLFAPSPAYTEIARRAHIEGLVVVRATIDREGRVTDVLVEKGLGFGLDEAAIEAVRRWTFEPATLRGRPVPVFFHLTARFELR